MTGHAVEEGGGGAAGGSGSGGGGGSGGVQRAVEGDCPSEWLLWVVAAGACVCL
jgi:hypothetical protein